VNTDDVERWPSLPWDGWKDTCETLHMWMQVVGKVKLELCPFLNEWWQVAFHLTARGMTTGIIPYRERTFDVEFDFTDHTLTIRTDDGVVSTLALAPRSVADFYHDFINTLGSMEIEVTINPLPTEVPDPIPCDTNRVHSSYDPDAVNRWWRIQVQTAKVLQRYRSPFVGKSSPIHFFWGSFDLNHTRFSGRPAPAPEGMPRFFQIAEDQENVACGFWPGNPNASGVTFGEPAFYSYIYPAPTGYRDVAVAPRSAYFDTTLGEFVLRYEDIRRSKTPEEELLTFFQSTYDVAADLAGWDRQALEKHVPLS
jgi:Family of unknown function (DUF5996)